MSVFDMFSKRKKRANDKNLDPYNYDLLPEKLRIQIIHIWTGAIGPYFQPSDYSFSSPPNNNTAWEFFQSTMCRELGKFQLGQEYQNSFEQCQTFLLTANTDNALDLIELTFKYVDRLLREKNKFELGQLGIEDDPDSAIDELNIRFVENNVGYQFVNGEIVRMDSQFIHKEAILPALSLIQGNKYAGAEQEFLNAHKHYKDGRFKETLNESLKALESVLKSICDSKKWNYPKNATANKLIETVFDNDLISKELQSQFSSLRATLESGVPTVRNNNAGHGQGSFVVSVPRALAAYALHMTASTIVFLIEMANGSD